MKIRLMSRRFMIAVFLPMLLLCVACGTESDRDESSPLSASASATPTHTETASADLATNSAPLGTTSAATEPETDIPNPYEGDMAQIYERAVSFAAAASQNEW